MYLISYATDKPVIDNMIMVNNNQTTNLRLLINGSYSKPGSKYNRTPILIWAIGRFLTKIVNTHSRSSGNINVNNGKNSRCIDTHHEYGNYEIAAVGKVMKGRAALWPPYLAGSSLRARWRCCHIVGKTPSAPPVYLPPPPLTLPLILRTSQWRYYLPRVNYDLFNFVVYCSIVYVLWMRITSSKSDVR